MRVEDLLVQNQMPARETKGADFLRENTKDTDLKGVDNSGKTGFSGDLRAISLKDPFYKKEDTKDKSIADELSEKGHLTEEQWEQNRMILSAHTMTGEEYEKMQEEGFDPKKMEPSDFVDIADKIRLQLARAGKDMSVTGDIDDAALKEMMGSEEAAAAAKQVLLKAQELGDRDALTDDQVDYMLRTDPEPTADNIYRAVSGGSEGMPPVQDIDAGAMEEMRPQIEKKIEQAGLPVNDENMQLAERLLKNGLPVNKDNMSLISDLSGELVTETTEVLGRISDGMRAGHSPAQTTLIKGFSEMDKATAAYEIINSDEAEAAVASLEGKDAQLTIENIGKEISEGAISDKAGSQQIKDVHARRVLEETRLAMTVEANFALISRGMEIDTMPLQQLVEELRNIELSAGEAAIRSQVTTDMLPEELAAIEEQVSLYNETEKKLGELAEMPAALMGHFPDIAQVTVEKLQQKGMTLSDEYKNAAERYDTMRTEVRRDLGDSIKKAFRNVDDILSDIGLENSEENRRAVRILAYNQQEINEESVLKTRNADSVVQRVFDSMTPGVVAEMIKRGENPLDKSLSDLQELADEIKGEGTLEKEGEDFADFLWRMEQSAQISDEEREAYIGIYRLMHQIVESDGAPIGALLAQDSEITMRNLMTATRSSKHSGREHTIDDETGFSQGFDRSVLTITQQIEMAFETARTRDAKEAVTPEKLHALGGEDGYLDLTPDQLASALERMNEGEVDDESHRIMQRFYEEQVQSLQKATEADSRVRAALERFDMTASAENLELMQQMIADRNKMHRDLYGRTGKRSTFSDIEKEASDLVEGGAEDMLSYMFEDLLEDYGEAVKTPEDMAEAQRKLAELAENAMRSIIEEDREVASLDVRAMKQVMRSVAITGALSQKEETYSIPVMVADQAGNISLKIVRGKEEEKGIVDIALDMPGRGRIYASMKADADGVNAQIRTDDPAQRDRLEAAIPEMADRLKKISGIDDAQVSVKLTAAVKEDPLFDDIETGDMEVLPAGSDISGRPVQTAKLYGMARSIIESVAKRESLR